MSGNELTESIKQPQAAKTSDDYSVLDRLAHEGALLASLPRNIGSGITSAADDAWQDKTRSGVELASALAFGAIFATLSRNPAPVVRSITTWTTRGFMGLAVADVGMRIGSPMVDAWLHKSNLSVDEKWMGSNVGGAVFNDGIGILAGASGAALADRYFATTALGERLQGFKTVRVEPEKAVSADKGSVPGLTGDQEQALSRALSINGELDPNVPGRLGNGRLEVRLFHDDSALISGKSNSVMFVPKDGPTVWFDKQQSLFGFAPKLKIDSLSHTDTGEQLYPGAREPLAKIGTGLINPSLSSNVYGFADGQITGVDAPSGQIYHSQSANWDYRPVTASRADATADPRFRYNLSRLSSTLTDYKKGSELGIADSIVGQLGELGIDVLQHHLLTDPYQTNPYEIKSGKTAP